MNEQSVFSGGMSTLNPWQSFALFCEIPTIIKRRKKHRLSGNVRSTILSSQTLDVDEQTRNQLLDFIIILQWFVVSTFRTVPCGGRGRARWHPQVVQLWRPPDEHLTPSRCQQYTHEIRTQRGRCAFMQYVLCSAFRGRCCTYVEISEGSTSWVVQSDHEELYFACVRSNMHPHKMFFHPMYQFLNFIGFDVS